MRVMRRVMFMVAINIRLEWHCKLGLRKVRQEIQRADFIASGETSMMGRV